MLSYVNRVNSMLDGMKENKATTMLVIGIMLIAINSVLITSITDDLISDGMAQQVTDAYDEQSDFDEEWATSTSEKVYFGYNLTDISALASDDPSNAYTKVGPWIYNVTSHKEILEWNDEEERFFAMHHPFTSPKDQDVNLLDVSPEKVILGSEIKTILL